jgi:flavin reductase (DIM6/NTAB) family NADH-FMN oxidoreductase RutF
MMRDMPHSVVVVTACSERDGPLKPTEDPEAIEDIPNLSPFYESFCGVTISSMTSVTLGPPAIISFNLRIPSRTLSGILQHQLFRIHLLGAFSSGAEVANSFIQHKHAEAFRFLAQKGRWIGFGTNPTSNVMAPLIRGAGVKGHLVCRIMRDKCIEVGDHMVVVATVEDSNIVASVRRHLLNNARPGLMYSDQKYKFHGGNIELPQSDAPRSFKVPRAGSTHEDFDIMKRYEEHMNQPFPLAMRLRRWNRSTYIHLANGYLQACQSIRNKAKGYPWYQRTYLIAVMLDELGAMIRQNDKVRYDDVALTRTMIRAAARLEELAEKDLKENGGGELVRKVQVLDGDDSLEMDLVNLGKEYREAVDEGRLLGESAEIFKDSRGENEKPWWAI